MKKSLFKIAVWSLFSAVVFMVSCDSTEDISKPVEIELPNADVGSSLAEIDVSSIEFKAIKENILFKNIMTGFDNPEIVSVQMEKEVLSGFLNFVVRIEDVDKIQRDIFIVSREEEGEHFIFPFIRLNNILPSEGDLVKFSGKVKWYAADGTELNEMILERNRIKKFSLKDLSSESARTEGCSWTCTKEQFNSHYQKAKNECESDWQCDFACSFNPCAIAYAVKAVSMCTRCITLAKGDIQDYPKLNRGDLNDLVINFL